MNQDNPKPLYGFGEFFCCLLILAAVLALFSPLRNAPFIIYDDEEYIVNNPHLEQGFSADNLLWAFTTFRCSNWHPVTWLSHIADYSLYGRKPGGHHLTSVLLHALNSVLLFLLIRLLTRKMQEGLMISLLVSGIFALHPQRLESVAWVSERKDVLSALFWMLSMISYVIYTRNKSLLAYGLLLFSFTLGLMSKPMLVTLPLILLLLDHWPLGRVKEGGNFFARNQGLLLEKIPLFSLSLLSGILTCIAQTLGGALSSTEKLPLLPRIVNAFVSYERYLLKFLWPAKLSIIYPYETLSLLSPHFLIALFFLSLVSALALKARNRGFLTGWLWFLITLLPVIGLIQVGLQSMADRYSYLPSVGLNLCLALGIVELMARFPRLNRLPFLFSGILLPLLFFLSAFELHHWKDPVSLFSKAVEVTTNNYIALNNLGCAYLESKDYPKASECFSSSLKIKPDYPNALNNLGNVLLLQKKPSPALESFEKALETNPNQAVFWYNKGSALYELRELSQATSAFEKALELKPDYFEAILNLGKAFLETGDKEKALNYFLKASQMKPLDPQGLKNAGLLYAKGGNFQAAFDSLKRALDLDAKDPEIDSSLGAVCFCLGMNEEAFAYLEKAIQMDPSNAGAWYNIGLMNFKLKNYEQASLALSKASELDPMNLETLVYAGLSFFYLEKYPESLKFFQKELEKKPSDFNTLYQMGLIFHKMGDPSSAEKQYEKLKSLKPDLAEKLKALIK